MDLQYNYYPNTTSLIRNVQRKTLFPKATRNQPTSKKMTSFPKSADSIKSPKMDLHSLVSPLQHHLNAPDPPKGPGIATINLRFHWEMLRNAVEK